MAEENKLFLENRNINFFTFNFNAFTGITAKGDVIRKYLVFNIHHKW